MVLENFKSYIIAFSIEGQHKQINNQLRLKRASRDNKEAELKKLNLEIKELEGMLVE